MGQEPDVSLARRGFRIAVAGMWAAAAGVAWAGARFYLDWLFQFPRWVPIGEIDEMIIIGLIFLGGLVVIPMVFYYLALAGKLPGTRKMKLKAGGGFEVITGEKSKKG